MVDTMGGEKNTACNLTVAPEHIFYVSHLTRSGEALKYSSTRTQVCSKAAKKNEIWQPFHPASRSCYWIGSCVFCYTTVCFCMKSSSNHTRVSDDRLLPLVDMFSQLCCWQRTRNNLLLSLVLLGINGISHNSPVQSHTIEVFV